MMVSIASDIPANWLISSKFIRILAVSINQVPFMLYSFIIYTERTDPRYRSILFLVLVYFL